MFFQGPIVDWKERIKQPDLTLFKIRCCGCGAQITLSTDYWIHGNRSLVACEDCQEKYTKLNLPGTAECYNPNVVITGRLR